MGGRGSSSGGGSSRKGTGPQTPAVGSDVQLGNGTQTWRVLRVDGEMVTIKGIHSLSSGINPTRVVHVSKLGFWKGKK